MKLDLKLDNKKDIEIIKNQIDNSEKIVLINHRRMDWDCLWSLLWFYEILKSKWKELKVINDDNIPESFSFLNIDKKLFQSNLNLLEYNPDLVISFDAADTHQLWNYYNKDIFDKLNLLVIDHHITNPGFWNYNLIHTELSSTCEITYELIKKLNYQESINQNIATYLLMWIITDTNSFFNTNTTNNTLKCAWELVKLWWKHQDIILNLFKKKSYNKMKLWWKVLEWLKDMKNESIIRNIIPRSIFIQTWTTDKDVWGLIDEFLTTIDSLKVAFLLYELEDWSIKSTFRSKTDEVDVSKFCEKFWWWWHKRASWFLIKNKNLYEVESMVINEIQKI